MNNSFVVVDKLNSVAYYCYSLVRFSFENFGYLMYYLPIDDSKCRIFTSRLIKKNDDSYLIVDISDEEKAKLNSISQRIFVDLPKSYSDNIDIYKLVNDFCFNNSITFLKELPSLKEQVLCSNSNLANSYLDYCNYVRNFYGNILSRVVISPLRPTLVWNVPTTNFGVESNSLPDEFNVLDVNMVTTDNVNNVSNNVNNNQVIGLGNVETIFPISSGDGNVPLNQERVENSTAGDYKIVQPIDFDVSSGSSINVDGLNYKNTTTNNSNDTFGNGFSFNFNTSYGYNSDGQDSSSGGPQLQSNMVKIKTKKAGFASNSYIIIGTVCLILAAIIVGISIVVVKNL